MSRTSELWKRIQHPWPAWRLIWGNREALGGNLFLLKVISAGLVVIALLYFLPNHLVNQPHAAWWNPETSLDRAIPVVPWSIVPYTSLYMFYIATLVCTPRNDRGRLELLLGLQGMFLMTVIGVFFFVAFPTEVSIRSQLAPELLAGEGWPGKLYGGLHTLDAPYNAWPSLHVAQSLYLALAMTLWLKREHAEARWLLPVLVFLWVDWGALSLSILTTKQHYLWDMVTGAARGLAFWHWHTKPLIDHYDTLDESYFEDPFAQS